MTPTDAPETDAPETEESRDEGKPRRRKTEMDVPKAEGVFYKHCERLYCLISFEWCVWIQRCVSLVDDCSGVWVGGWLAVCIRACEEAGGRKIICSGLFSCSHSVYKVMN